MPKPDFAMIDWTDAQLDQLFLRSEPLPLDDFVNGGEHRVDLDAHEIYNDQRWKGFMPKDLLATEVVARLSLGFAKKLWTLKVGFGGETQYFGGKIATKHSVRDITLDEPTHDLPSGRYVLLGYTNPVLGRLFYDLVKPIGRDVMIFRGCTGRFPGGKRGWTALLLRRYPFAQMGIDDHNLLFSSGSAPTDEELAGEWRLDALYYSNQPARIAGMRFDRAANGALQVLCDTSHSRQRMLLPKFVAEHFQTEHLRAMRSELRTVDRDYIVGKWTMDLRGPSATLLLASAPGWFHREKGSGRRPRFTLYYLLTRTQAA